MIANQVLTKTLKVIQMGMNGFNINLWKINKIQQLNEFNIDYVVECKSEILYEHHNGTSLSDFISQYNKHVL